MRVRDPFTLGPALRAKRLGRGEHGMRILATGSRWLSDQDARVRATHLVGPDGKQMTLAQLPSPRLKRWLPRHKALVVAAVRHGLITFDEACERYSLSLDEYLSWQRSFDAAPRPAAATLRDYRN
jgi:Protein of unknown function (DUF1153)